MSNRFPLRRPTIIGAYFCTAGSDALPALLDAGAESSAKAAAVSGAAPPTCSAPAPGALAVSSGVGANPGVAGLKPVGMPCSSGGAEASCAMRTLCTSCGAVCAFVTENSCIVALPVGDFAIASPKLKLGQHTCLAK